MLKVCYIILVFKGAFVYVIIIVLKFIFLLKESSFEFSIISLENKTWHFEASSVEERDSWISAIEQQILSSLQNSDGDKKNETDAFKMHCIKNKVSGNDACVDCGAPSEWIFFAFCY